jgi:hypothetical protein
MVFESVESDVSGEEAFVCSRRIEQNHAVPPAIDK